MANEIEWLDDIGKYVLEEDQIVTYKWLSKKLNIHVNISKQLLYTFASQHENDKLGICYLVGGLMPDDSCRIVVSKKEELPKVKSDFKQITSEHVYSLQKNTTDADLNVILTSGKDNNNEDNIKCSAIQCSDSVLRNNSDIQELKIKALLANKTKNTAIVKSNVQESKKQLTSDKENLSESDLNSSKQENEANAEPTKNKKAAGIAAMFAAQKDTKKVKDKPQVQQKNKPKGGLSAFLSSGTKTSANVNNDKKKAKEVIPAEDNEESEVQIETVSEKEKVNRTEKNEESDLPKSSKDVENPKDKAKNKSKNSQSKRKRNTSKEDNTDKKKRKRIVMWSDSESSGGEEAEDEPMNTSPPREPTPPPPLASDDEDVIPATPEVGKKAKKRKLIEKTFMDKDGYLVTNKEYAMVSEDEEECNKKEESVVATNGSAKLISPKPATNSPSKNKQTSPLKNKKSPSKGKKPSPQSKKQASIKSFFTKK